MVIVKPLYQAYEKEDSKRGTNNLYLDTQIVNYLRKNTHPDAGRLKQLLSDSRFKHKLYYSSAHLGDYLKDQSDHKNHDLNYMESISMANFLSYDPYKRVCLLEKRSPIHVFYNGRINSQQVKRNYEIISKPKIDHSLLQMYDWFKETLIKYEKDESYINKLDERNARVFLSLMDEVKLTSSIITPDLFLEKSEEFWRNNIFTLNNKDASKYFLRASLSDYDIMNYQDEIFDLRKPNLIEEIQPSKFKQKIQEYIEHVMYGSGLDFKSNYDELTLFRMSFGCLQILGIEPDKAKKFNVRSMSEDATHFYFASTCNHLITEDDGLYRRAKILYGVLGVTTKVFRISELLEHISLNN